MKILALDSSGNVASAAVTENNTLIAEYTINHKKTHSQTLMGMLDEIVKMTELDLKDLDAFAVAAGPGSFTGLRIGSATVKGLAMALDKPVIGVPTVDALAYNIYGFDGVICPLMDARRSQVYTGLYTFADSCEFSVIKEQCAVAIEEIIEEVNARGEKTVFLGDGVPVHRETLAKLLKVPYSFAPAHIGLQNAASLASLAEIRYGKGMYESAAEHAPDYLRVSQAEREREEAKERKQAE